MHQWAATEIRAPDGREIARNPSRRVVAHRWGWGASSCTIVGIVFLKNSPYIQPEWAPDAEKMGDLQIVVCPSRWYPFHLRFKQCLDLATEIPFGIQKGDKIYVAVELMVVRQTHPSRMLMCRILNGEDILS